jgi:hypothetical protein
VRACGLTPRRLPPKVHGLVAVSCHDTASRASDVEHENLVPLYFGKTFFAWSKDGRFPSVLPTSGPRSLEQACVDGRLAEKRVGGNAVGAKTLSATESRFRCNQGKFNRDSN